jgi:hypothetical protein
MDWFGSCHKLWWNLGLRGYGMYPNSNYWILKIPYPCLYTSQTTPTAHLIF